MYQLDKRKTLLRLIENSIGTRLFRNAYFFVNGKSKDILKMVN
jgi:NADH:ubiquinone oxidoreductase subunit D